MGVLVSKTGGWLPLCMAIDMPPFDDVRVRQAMRLIVDRKADARAGRRPATGSSATTSTRPSTPATTSRCRSGEQDIEQAKSLLKAAGKAEPQPSTCTPPTARPAWSRRRRSSRTRPRPPGVKVNVDQRPELLRRTSTSSWPFSVDFWGTRSYLNQVQQGSLPNSPYNETHWPPKSGTGSNFESLYNQALADDRRRPSGSRSSTRCSKLEYDVGGYIIPFFGDLIDGYAAKRARGSSRARARSTWIASATATARSGSASGRRRQAA